METTANPHVLLVDDDAAHSEALATVLERAGYEVELAGDVREAAGRFAARAPDLIVTDLKMPGESGLDLLCLLTAFDRTVPVLILTAYGEWETYLAAMESGAADYLTKPVRREAILAAIAKALTASRARMPENAADVDPIIQPWSHPTLNAFTVAPGRPGRLAAERSGP